MFGVNQRCHGDALFARFTESLKNVDADIEAIRNQARDQAVIATEAIRDYNKIYTDNRSKKTVSLQRGRLCND